MLRQAMPAADRPFSRPRWLYWCCLWAGLGLGGLGGPAARAQEARNDLRLTEVRPAGARRSATESWGMFDCHVENRSDRDRLARAIVFYPEQPDVQYGRDLWVPAHATLSSWMLVGPAAPQEAETYRDVRILLYDRTDGKDEAVLPTTQERIRSQPQLYRRRGPTTTVLIDEYVSFDPGPGALPRPDTPAEEAIDLGRTFRLVRHLSENVEGVHPSALAPAAEAFDGIDHVILTTEQIRRDPGHVQALRQWLHRGGHMWVMLDRVGPEVLAPFLGDALDFQVVDHVGLTRFRIDPVSRGHHVQEQGELQEHDRPVDFARVLLPAGERVRHAVNGWPAWFTRPVGRGKVVFTTLGPRAWFRPRKRSDGLAPFPNFPMAPVPVVPLDVVANELAQEDKPFHHEKAGAEERKKAQETAKGEKGFDEDAFRKPLTEEIGYTIPGPGTVSLVFGGFLLVTLALGMALRRSRRPELVGWLGPTAALGATGVFLAVGGASRQAVPQTVAVAEVVHAVPGMDEAPVEGLLAVYHPDSGPTQAGAEYGGLFKLDMTGVEGQTRRWLLTDRRAWHWDNLTLPAGVRFAPFDCTIPTGEPLAAVAHFGPDGLEGKLTTGPFRDLADALLTPPSGRNLAVRLAPNGTFRAGSRDALPAGQFLSGAVLTDEQQRRQDLYGRFLQGPVAGRLEGRNVLLAWASPAATHFNLGNDVRTVGMALLVIPLRLERTPAGTPVTIPGPLVPYMRILDDVPTRPTLSLAEPVEMQLRFQLPPEVLPLRVERTRLNARIEAPGRRVTVAGRDGARQVELARVESPLDPIHVEITQEPLLRLDKEGGLHLNLNLSDIVKGSRPGKNDRGADTKWTIEYLELEVAGRTPEK